MASEGREGLPRGLILLGRTLMLSGQGRYLGHSEGKGNEAANFWLLLRATWGSVRRASGNPCEYLQDTKYGPVSSEEVSLRN